MISWNAYVSIWISSGVFSVQGCRVLTPHWKFVGQTNCVAWSQITEYGENVPVNTDRKKKCGCGSAHGRGVLHSHQQTPSDDTRCDQIMEKLIKQSTDPSGNMVTALVTVK